MIGGSRVVFEFLQVVGELKSSCLGDFVFVDELDHVVW